jgi:hypothetical protein
MKPICYNRASLALLGAYALFFLAPESANATFGRRAPQTVAYQAAPSYTVGYQPTACQPTACQSTACQPVVTTAYMPVATQPANTRWYLGKWFDQMRIRRWERRSNNSPTYAATVGTPVYSVSYAPAVASSPCGGPACATAARPYMTSYAPMAYQSLYRPVALSPVASPCASACSTSSCSPCGDCSTTGYSGGVGQAIYQAPSSSCSSCAGASTGPVISNTPQAGPYTGQPQLPDTAPNSAAQSQTNYPPGGSQGSPNADNSSGGANGTDGTGGRIPPVDPSPEPPEGEANQSTNLEPPQLLDPNDLTARHSGWNVTGSARPSVAVHTAVYHKPITTSAISRSRRSQPARVELDTEG